MKAFETAQIHRFVWPFQALSIIHFGSEEVGEFERREGRREREEERRIRYHALWPFKLLSGSTSNLRKRDCNFNLISMFELRR